MSDYNRRNMIKNIGVLAGASLLTSIGTNAASASEHIKRRRTRTVEVRADSKGVCATCKFWGGIRLASEDKKTVYCESLGWCSNPDSHHYQSMTTPVTGPMESWQKWEAL